MILKLGMGGVPTWNDVFEPEPPQITKLKASFPILSWINFRSSLWSLSHQPYNRKSPCLSLAKNPCRQGQDLVQDWTGQDASFVARED